MAILVTFMLFSVPISGCLGFMESDSAPSGQDDPCDTAPDSEDCLKLEPRPQDCSVIEIFDGGICRDLNAPDELDYGITSTKFYVGIEIDPYTPSFIGDGPDVWLVSPNLPEGLILDSETGVLSGIPFESGVSTHTIVASNPAGSSSIDIFLEITIEPPSDLQYDLSELVCISGQQCHLPPPDVTGAQPMQWTSQPPLPEGFSFDDSGSITGSSIIQASTNHVIRASNEAGNSSTTVMITIVPTTPVDFAYPDSPIEYAVGDLIEIVPHPNPGEDIEWSVTPMLPEGIHIDSEGVVRGNANTTFDWSQYKITASNSQGSSQGIILIRVTDVAPTSIGYPESNLILRVGVPMEGMSPTTLSVVDHWSIEPNPPPGISINSLTGEISGTPASVSDSREYTVTASNSGGSTSATIYIEVKIPPPSGIQWPSFEMPLRVNTQISITPSNAGPTVESWESDPPLPDGLQFLPNGTIEGTPIERHPWTFHSLWANNSGGSLQQRVWLSVIDTQQDQSDLSYGIGSVDYPGYASSILPVGPYSFPIAVAGPDDFPVISGSHVGRGKMIGYGHESWVDLTSNENALDFALRAVEWACGENAEVGLATGAGFDTFSDELEAEGHSTSSAHPDDLSEVDCLIAEFWNGYDSGDNAAIVQFVSEGGGLIMGGHSWYWSYSNDDVAHEYPGNRIATHTGLLVSSIHGQGGENVRFDWGNDPLMTPWNAAQSILEHSHGAITLSDEQASTIGTCLSPLISFVPYDYPDFWSRLHHVVNSSGWTIIDAQYGHEFGQDPLEDTLLTIESGIISVMPPSLIPSHPSHAEFPGVIQASSPRIQENITFHSNQTGLPSQFGYSQARSMILLSTGLYAPPGEQVFATMPSDLIDSGAMLQVGVHSDTLWHKSTIYRFPSIVRSFTIESTNISIANAFGGPIYLAVPPEGPLGSTWINFDGAVKAPKYEHGETTSSDWQSIRDYPAPWAEVSSDQFIMSVPSSEIRTLDNPEDLMDFWEQALEMEHDLYGFTPWPRIERAVFDVQISAGWMHSGYPFMAHLASASGAVDLSHMESEGDWGMFHELGHNHQWMPSTLPGTTETGCNFASVYLMEELVGISGHSATTSEQRHQRMTNYFGSGADIDDWSVWVALDTYLIIKEEWGWTPITDALTVYYTLPNSEVPYTDLEEFNAWVVHLSDTSGYNLAPYHEAWGFPLTNETHDSLLHLPVWVDDPVRGNYAVFDSIIRNMSASYVASTSANLLWDVYDNGTDTQITVYYGDSDHGESESSWPSSEYQGTAQVGSVSILLEDLSPSTTYHARIKASNSNGQIWFGPITWTTSGS